MKWTRRETSLRAYLLAFEDRPRLSAMDASSWLATPNQKEHGQRSHVHMALVPSLDYALSLGEMTQEAFETRIGKGIHDDGCTFGGFSCGYWIIVDGCKNEHWESHIVAEDETCPCGNTFPGASRGVVFLDASS
jgi:hypothetical protein